MNPYWVTTKKGSSFCQEMSELDAEATINRDDIQSVQVLPYPAEPRSGKTSSCPSFCYSPRYCAGHTSCPHQRSCSE